VVSDLFGVENEKKVGRHVKKLGKTEFVPDRRTVLAAAYRLAAELNLPHKFNKEKKWLGTTS
jgi:hypothetical protein